MQPLCGAYINDSEQHNDLNVDHPIVNKASSSSSAIGVATAVVIGVFVLAGGFYLYIWYKAEYSSSPAVDRFS